MSCPHCGGGFEVQTEWIGQQAECPYCRRKIVISPYASSSAPTMTPPLRMSAQRDSWGITNAEAENIKNLFMWWWISLAAAPVTCGLGFLASFVLFCILLYKFWELVPASQAETTPGKAVGFCFIPFFVFYWIYIAYYKLAKHYDVFDNGNSIRTSTMAKIYCILFWASSGISILQYFFQIVLLIAGMGGGDNSAAAVAFSIFFILLGILCWGITIANVVFWILLVIRIKGHVVDRMARIG